MAKNRFTKSFIPEPWKKYWVQDWDGELKEVDIKKSQIKQFIDIKTNRFMKSYFLWDEEDKRIIALNWDLFKYFYILGKFSDEDNCINMEKFRAFQNVSWPYYSRLKKILVDRGIITRKNKLYYLNPIFCMKRDKMSLELWEMFKEKNAQLYWITEL
jgi:hypothetical protein